MNHDIPALCIHNEATPTPTTMMRTATATTDSTTSTSTTATMLLTTTPPPPKPPSLDYTKFRDILLVGEANFSFTRAMIRHLTKNKQQVQQQNQQHEQQVHHVHEHCPLPRITATEYGSSVNIAERYFNRDLLQLSASLNQLRLVPDDGQEEEDGQDHDDKDKDDKTTTTRTRSPIIIPPVEIYASLDATSLAKRNRKRCCDGGGGGGGESTECCYHGCSDNTGNPLLLTNDNRTDIGSEDRPSNSVSKHGTGTGTTAAAAATEGAHAERWNPMTQTWDPWTCFWDSIFHHHHHHDHHHQHNHDNVFDGFDLIIFNFPHTNKHGKASRLLKSFFQQVQKCLMDDENNDDNDTTTTTTSGAGHCHCRRRFAPHVLIELRLRDDDSPFSPVRASNKVRVGYNHLRAASEAHFVEWRIPSSCDTDTTDNTDTTGNTNDNDNDHMNDLPYWESLGYQHCMTRRNATCRGIPCKVWRGKYKSNNNKNHGEVDA